MVRALLIASGNTYEVSVIGPNDERPVDATHYNSRIARETAEELVQRYYPHDCEELGCEDWIVLGNV
jgi:hypothetical protein